ncbi:MAG TPA: hypothetical protein VI731_00960 [Bacteroidia bacterium]|nr:hypothetical protein [Bacteroidia bacterium]
MQPKPGNRTFETPLSLMWFNEDGIFCSITKKNAPLTKAALRESFEFIRANSGGNKVCWLGNVTNLSPPEKEARDYAAEETPKFIQALALITNSTLSKFIANVFLQLKKPPYPTRLFTNEEDALQWLRQFKNETAIAG